MKRAVSISIGSSKRNKTVEIELLGEQVRIERIGTDGDMEKAAQLYRELDGKVDAFGVGGTDLAIQVGEKKYVLHSVKPMVRYVQTTPLVDGSGLKNTLEYQIVETLESQVKDYLDAQGRKVIVTSAVDRWGMAMSFVQGGYEYILCDLMFALGLPIPIRNINNVKFIAALLVPIASRLPFHWIYPTGEKQEVRVPKWESYYRNATVTAGDCNYIRRHIPDDMQGKIIATNTTTPSDVELFRNLGVKYLLTTTPVLDGRSFGTNMMEAALIAVSGKRRVLTRAELNEMLQEIGYKPQIQELN